jgi:phage tail-like protein
MATSADDMKTAFPLPVYHYSVQIGSMENMRFSEVSGLSMERKLITYKDGMSASQGALYLPGQSGDPSITLKRGVTPGSKELYEWFASIQQTIVNKQDVLISLMNESGDAPVVTWKVLNAFPTKMDAPGFNATSNEVAVETLQLAASNITVEYH